MAQKSTGKQKTTGQKSSSGKAASRKTGKSAAEQPAVRREGSEFARQAGPYILAVVGILLAVCMLAGDGIVGGGIQKLFCGLFGVIAYTLPLYFLILAFIWRAEWESGLLRWKVITAAVIAVFTAQLAHIFDGGLDTFHPVELFKNGMTLHGGGVFGGWLGVIFIRGFGKVCTLVIAFGLLFVLTLFLFGVTPRGLWVTLLYRIRVAREKRQERKNMPKPPSGGLAARNRIREEEYAAYLREKKQKEREARKAAAEAQKAAEWQQQETYTGGSQINVPTPQPTVYRVKRRKITDIPIDEGDEPAAQGSTIDLLEPVPPEADVVDEKIFDEVMRRTRERVEKSAKKSGVDLQTSAAAGSSAGKTAPEKVQTLPTAEGNLQVDTATGEVLQAETIPQQEEDDVPWYEDSEPMEECREFTRPVMESAEKTETKATETPEETAESFDLSGFFVNPEDAELLDRLSEAYLKKDEKSASLDVNRETVASAAAEKAEKPAREAPVPYNYPPIEILTEETDEEPVDIKEELQDNAVKLVETLKSFHVNTKIENISRGPTITRYELKPEMGTKVRSIANLVDDIALNLATTGVRIEAPIPGKAAVGIEVPNKRQSTVHLRTLIQSEAFVGAKSKLTCCLGEDVAGEAVYFDIAKMPHLLIAGATGMGKSVCINSLVVSLLYKASPEEVKLILVDPKKVELSIYNGIPHLLVPVVSDPKKAAGSLSWAVGEMERRFGLIEAVGVRDVKTFNEFTKNDPDYEFLPQIVIIIDELADLMMTAPDDVEESICRLAQKARAAGMHLIIGTQRPSVDVITGLIKANIPSRIAFTVASQIDSRTIIDRGGAENLIGRGDMLFNPVGAAKPMRVQGAYVSESDVEEVVSYIKNMNQKSGSYSDEVLEQIEMEAARCGAGKKGSSSAASAEGDSGEDDPMLRQALELAVESGKISTSLIQRRLQLGYGRAAKLIDRMEQMGYVSPPDGQKPRKVLITKQEFMELVLNNEVD